MLSCLHFRRRGISDDNGSSHKKFLSLLTKFQNMTIKASGNQYKIEIEQSLLPITEVQKFLDYLRLRNIVSESKASEAEISDLVTEINKDGISRIQDSLLKRIGK